MAKRTCEQPEEFNLRNVHDIYSVGSCVNADFADYFNYWKHNGYWLFDSPDAIRAVAAENAISLHSTKLFYYEAHEMELAEDGWREFSPEPSIPTKVLVPLSKSLEGFDVVTCETGRGPDHSPLSCNGLADEFEINSHCLFDSFRDAFDNLNAGKFTKCEPGPYRIFAVYSVDWPGSLTTDL